MIKMPTPNELRYFPTVEEGGSGAVANKKDYEDETEEAGCENTTIISSIAKARKNSSFTEWQPFISSSWQKDSSQNSLAQP
jgi:hypothetical protein